MTNNEIEFLLQKELNNITPNCLDKIKLKAQYIKPDEIEDKKSRQILRTRSLFTPLKLSISLVLILLLIFSISGVSVYGKEIETVSIDVNPSIEFSINRFDRVIAVNYNNEDAIQLFKNINLKNKTIDEALVSCYDELLVNGYLDDSETNQIIISTYSESEEKSSNKLNHYIELLKKLNEENKMNCEIEKNLVLKELKEFAKENNLSYGQLKYIEEILEYDIELEFDDLAQMKMKDLKKKLKELQEENHLKNNENPKREDYETEEEYQAAKVKYMNNKKENNGNNKNNNGNNGNGKNK